MKTIRAFIAIQLPVNFKNELTRVSKTLAAPLPSRSVRWLKQESMHLTLRFLGDTAVSKLPTIYDLLDKSAANQKAFSLRLGELGCFPNCKRPRVIWAGLQGDLEAVQQLKGEIDGALTSLGWEKEKRAFHPHLTLGRIKDRNNLKDRNWKAEIESLTMLVDSIHLIESELTPSGAIHTVRHTSRLQAEIAD